MHTVELLRQAQDTAERLGFRVRLEWLGGSGGGGCEFGGRKWLFVDLSLNVVEQLEQVVQALREDPGIYLVEMPGPLRQLLGIRKSA